MPARQRLAAFLVTVVALGSAAALTWAAAQPVPAYPAAAAAPRFDADRALAEAVTLATDYPDRVVGSETSARARAWLLGRFAELGLPTASLPFTATVASQARGGVQVWATSPGASDEIILVSAHYDVPQTGIPGAADDASGIGTVLELARVFAGEPHQRTFIFMASDSEEYGAFWGAKNFSEQFPQKNKIVAVLDLDYLSARDLKRINLSSAGLHRGYTPLWLRQVGLAAIEAAGAEANEADGLLEYLYRAIPIGAADYSMYLRAGLAAVNFGGEPTDPQNWLAEYHTPLDTPEKLRAPAFALYGRAAEIWLRTVDALDPLPANVSDYFRLNRSRYVPGWAMQLAQALVFVPLALTFGMAWSTQKPRADEMRPEFLAWLALVVIGLDGYATAFSLVSLGYLPRYEMFPANPNDPFLLQPTWWAVAVIAGVMLLFGWYTFRVGGWGFYAGLLDIPFRRTTLLGLLAVLSAVVWLLNGFTATALLGPAALLWPWIEPGERLLKKLLNLALALAGAAPFAAFVAFFAANFPIGPWWWYLTLGAAYGLFPPLAVGLFLGALALMLRFMAHGLKDS